MFTQPKSIVAQTFNYTPHWEPRQSIYLRQLTLDWIDYLIIRKLRYYCHNSLPISDRLAVQEETA